MKFFVAVIALVAFAQLSAAQRPPSTIGGVPKPTPEDPTAVEPIHPPPHPTPQRPDNLEDFPTIIDDTKPDNLEDFPTIVDDTKPDNLEDFPTIVDDLPAAPQPPPAVFNPIHIQAPRLPLPFHPIHIQPPRLPIRPLPRLPLSFRRGLALAGI